MSWKDMRISVRLVIGFSMMGMLIVGLGAIALWKSISLDAGFTVVTQQRMPRMVRLNAINHDLDAIAIAMREILLVQTADEHQRERQKMLSYREKIGTSIEHLKKEIQNPQGQVLLQDLIAKRVQYVAEQDKFLTLVDAGEVADARQHLVVQARPVLDAFEQTVTALKDFQGQLLDESVAVAHADVRSIQTSVWLAIGFAVVVAILLALQTIRAITGPLRQAVEVAKAVAAGDLSVQFEAQGRNETAQLLQALQQMLHSLREVVGQVRSGSASVASASGQIAQANLDLSSRTEEQASALEETAASMEQLGATVKHNADSAVHANQLARSATEVAQRGGTMVAQVVQTMQGIDDSSHRIADIIGVIDGIAFQTNILALNAAVEAARAGSRGAALPSWPPKCVPWQDVLPKRPVRLST